MDLKEKKISSEEIYKGRIINLFKDQVECPNGHISTREVIRHCKAACIIAELNGKFIIEEQYRYPYDDIIKEFPAGKAEINENIKDVALRELEEETGYHANTIKFLGDMYPSCAYTDEVISIFYCTDLIKTKKNLDEDEFINLSFVSLDELKELVKNNVIKDAKTICALQLFLLNK